MQQFTIPQFIDVEDKIIGPITTRQFLILLGGFMLIAVFYKLFDFSLFVFSSVIVLSVVGVFAFTKINGRPFHYFILNLIQTVKKPNLRVWRHDDLVVDEEEVSLEKATADPALSKKRYTNSRLAELSLIVDTRGAFKGVTEGSEVKKIN